MPGPSSPRCPDHQPTQRKQRKQRHDDDREYVADVPPLLAPAVRRRLGIELVHLPQRLVLAALVPRSCHPAGPMPRIARSSHARIAGSVHPALAPRWRSDDRRLVLRLPVIVGWRCGSDGHFQSGNGGFRSRLTTAGTSTGTACFFRGGGL